MGAFSSTKKRRLITKFPLKKSTNGWRLFKPHMNPWYIPNIELAPKIAVELTRKLPCQAIGRRSPPRSRGCRSHDIPRNSLSVVLGQEAPLQAGGYGGRQPATGHITAVLLR